MIITSLTISGNEVPDLCPLPVGSMAPYFSGIDQYGQTHSLETFKEKGPFVLFFHYGYWCRYCIEELKIFNKELQYLKSFGINVLVITQEGEEFRNKVSDKPKQNIPALIDFNQNIMRTYRVAQSKEHFKNNTAPTNQIKSLKEKSVPIQATFIITKTGIIDFVHYDPDQKSRVSTSKILNQLKVS